MSGHLFYWVKRKNQQYLIGKGVGFVEGGRDWLVFKYTWPSLVRPKEASKQASISRGRGVGFSVASHFLEQLWGSMGCSVVVKLSLQLLGSGEWGMAALAESFIIIKFKIITIWELDLKSSSGHFDQLAIPQLHSMNGKTQNRVIWLSKP